MTCNQCILSKTDVAKWREVVKDSGRKAKDMEGEQLAVAFAWKVGGKCVSLLRGTELVCVVTCKGGRVHISRFEFLALCSISRFSQTSKGYSSMTSYQDRSASSNMHPKETGDVVTVRS